MGVLAEHVRGFVEVCEVKVSLTSNPALED